MNTKLLHRLAWKELCTLRALWLSLLGMAFVLQLGLAWFARHPHERSEWVFSVALFLPVVYSLACAAMSFAGECEEGTDQLLSRLAVPPLGLLITKVAMNLLSTVALLAILYPLAWKLVPLQHAQLPSMQMLALAWGLSLGSWGLFFSLLFRRVLTCLVASTVAATLTPLIVFALLDLLPSQQARNFEAFDWTLRLAVIPGLLLLASSLLVQTWDENRWPRIVELLLDGWRRWTATRERSSGTALSVEKRSGDWRVLVRPFGLCLPDEVLPAWRREARRLLWLEWRQAWRVMLFLVAAYGMYLSCQVAFVASGVSLFPGEYPFVMALLAFMFGAWSFQAQQSGQRFRDFAGHGASPAAMWCIKQGVWTASMLFTALALTAGSLWFVRISAGGNFESWQWHTFKTLVGKLAYGFRWQSNFGWIDPSLLGHSLGNLLVSAALSLGLCFAVGQFVSLLIPRAVTALAVGFVLAGVAFGWQQLIAHLAVPSGIAVLPLVVGLLMASFVRMSDWMEERSTLRAWLRVIGACVVPSLVTLIGVPMYRVYEVPDVDADYRRALADALVVTPEAKQTADRWVRAAESLDEAPVFRWKRREWSTSTGEEIEREAEYSPISLFDVPIGSVCKWTNLKDREWLTRHAELLVEADQISKEPDCAFESEIFSTDSPQNRFTTRGLARLMILLKMAAQAAMADGRLEDALPHMLVLQRFSLHVQQHGGWDAVSTGERLELGAWDLLLEWASHPAQTGDSLRAALGRSADASPHPLSESIGLRWGWIEIASAVKPDHAVAKKELARHWREAPWQASLIFWEQRREERLLDFTAMTVEKQLRQSVPASTRSGWGDERLSRILPELPEHGGLVDLLRATTPSSSFRWENPYLVHQRIRERALTELRRRALIATLALRAFHLDHGRWSAQWEELIGPYVDRVPVDPWTGLPFEYRPQGFPFDVHHHGIIRANSPLLLSGGPSQQHLVPTVRPPLGEETSPQVEWWLIGKHGSHRWLDDRYRQIDFIVFPLSATEW